MVRHVIAGVERFTSLATYIILVMAFEKKLVGEYAGASLAVDWGLMTSIQMLSVHHQHV